VLSYALAPDVSCAEADPGLVLLDGRRGKYFQLNGTGADILRSLLEGRGMAETASTLARASGEPAERVTRDVELLVKRLCRARLLKVVRW
jgi:hypothetical protein